MILSEDLVDSHQETKQNGAGDSKTPDFSEEELNFSGSTPDISFDHQSSRAQSSLGADAEISYLQEKHLVKHILGEFSRSFPNLTKITGRNTTTPPPEISRSADTSLQEIDEELSVLPSVRDLKKKFEAVSFRFLVAYEKVKYIMYTYQLVLVKFLKGLSFSVSHYNFLQ